MSSYSIVVFLFFLSNKDFYCSSVSEQSINSNLCSERLFGQNTSQISSSHGKVNKMKASDDDDARTPPASIPKQLGTLSKCLNPSRSAAAVQSLASARMSPLGGSLYLETPTTERTDRESSEECPRHRTFRPKLLTFSGGGPHPFDQAGVPVGYFTLRLPIIWTLTIVWLSIKDSRRPLQIDTI